MKASIIHPRTFRIPSRDKPMLKVSATRNNEKFSKYGKVRRMHLHIPQIHTHVCFEGLHVSRIKLRTFSTSRGRGKIRYPLLSLSALQRASRNDPYHYLISYVIQYWSGLTSATYAHACTCIYMCVCKSKR